MVDLPIIEPAAIWNINHSGWQFACAHRVAEICPTINQMLNSKTLIGSPSGLLKVNDGRVLLMGADLQNSGAFCSPLPMSTTCVVGKYLFRILLILRPLGVSNHTTGCSWCGWRVGQAQGWDETMPAM
jgi:hypothetical protein